MTSFPSWYGAGTTEFLNFIGFTSADAIEVNLTDTMITDALGRAQAEIRERTKTHFVDSAGTVTPDWASVSNEKHNGQGKFDRAYYTIRYPLPNISATLAGTVTPSGTALIVDSTNKFPASGILEIAGNKITYTGKAASGTAFTGCGTVSGTVIPGVTITPFCLEFSTDDQGVSPTWTVATQGDEEDIDFDTGRFYLYKNTVQSSVYTTDNPPSYTPNRVRISYIYGWDSIPLDITRLTLMLASRDLMQMIVRKSYMKGFNNFKPEMIGVSDELIEETIGRYQNPLFGNIH